MRIPKVEDFVAECLKHNMKVIIDLKSWESPDETINLVTSLYKQMPALRTSALVTSFFPQLLYKLRSSDINVCEEKTSMLRSADPDIICSLSTRPYFLSSTVYEGTDAGLRPRFIEYSCSLRIHHIPIPNQDFRGSLNMLREPQISCSLGFYKMSFGGW